MQSERDSRVLYRKALLLEYFTVGYNFVEAGVAIAFGQLAGSSALIGFGLDSIVESLSGMILIWRLSKHKKISEEAEERVERRAARFVALTFFLLGMYVLYHSLDKILTGDAPDPSFPGIIIAFVSLIIMPLLARQKWIVGKSIQSRALIADSKETLACSFLSLALLAGLGLNYLFGLWYADSIAGMIIVIFLFREGREAWLESGSD